MLNLLVFNIFCLYNIAITCESPLYIRNITCYSIKSSKKGMGMKSSELIRLLKKHGCRIIEHGAKHDIWFSPVTGKTFLVWRHKSREMPAGTARRILKDAGIKEE